MTKSARAPHGQAQVLQRKDTELPAFDCLVKVGDSMNYPVLARAPEPGESGVARPVGMNGAVPVVSFPMKPTGTRT